MLNRKVNISATIRRRVGSGVCMSKKRVKKSSKKADLNGNAFSKLDLKKHSGKCIALVNGKVVVSEKDPKKAMERVVALSKHNQVALICVPSSKTTMCI